METRTVAGTDLVVSVVGLGCNNFGRRLDAAATDRVVGAALDKGINFFDTADIYGPQESERFLGAALKERRDQAIVATKFGGAAYPDHADWAGASAKHLRHATEQSLKRLGTDRIDLLQLHFPDPKTPIEETLGALDQLVKEGKVRYAGCSNFAGWMIADADWTSRAKGLARFVTVQNNYSLLNRGAEVEVLPACAHFDLDFIPYTPLAGGLLTGKYRRGQPAPAGTRLAGNPRASQVLSERNFDLVEALEGFARDRSLSLVAVAVGWLAAQPRVCSVIAGATSPDQVAANIAAAAWKPSEADLAELSRITS